MHNSTWDDLANWLQLDFKSLATKTPNQSPCERGIWKSEIIPMNFPTKSAWHDVCTHKNSQKKISNPSPTTNFCDLKGGWFHQIFFSASFTAPPSCRSWWAAWLAIEWPMGSWCRCLVLTLTLSITQADWIAWKNDQRQGQLRGKRRTWISRINGWTDGVLVS